VRRDEGCLPVEKSEDISLLDGDLARVLLLVVVQSHHTLLADVIHNGCLLLLKRYTLLLIRPFMILQPKLNRNGRGRDQR
jgi:hypothetical protein